MIEIFILSLVQGVTEFLPISSSSHLILLSNYLNFQNQSLSIDVSLHVGSFLAIMFYFKKDIIEFYKNKILFYKIFISSLPVMIVGYFFVELEIIDKLRNLKIIALTTFIFGVLLYVSDKFKSDNNIDKHFTLKSAVFIGLLQVLSLIPGVSRSGIAITAARLLNFKRLDSAKISFLLSIPILGAVSVFGLRDMISNENFNLTKFNLISVGLSFFFSLITIKYFLIYIKKFNLNVFVYYRVFLGFLLMCIAYL